MNAYCKNEINGKFIKSFQDMLIVFGKILKKSSFAFNTINCLTHFGLLFFMKSYNIL